MSKGVDFNKLYQELKSNIDEDKMYWIKNDAKLRAVVTSNSYDEFKDIVAAAHLKPVSKKDKGKSKNSWNSMVDN